MRELIDSLLTPPGMGLALILAGLLLWRFRRWSLSLLVAGVVIVYALSTPVAAKALLGLLESAYPALEQVPEGVGAIVVLGAGRNESAPEYGGGDTVNALGLERLRYAAYLHRRTDLPILLTGGATQGEPEAVAELAEVALSRDFQVEVRWLEGRSRNTYENAVDSARILEAEGIRRVLVVTHAAHMPRAMWCFREAGLDPVAAPTGFLGHDADPGWLPSAFAQLRSTLALHELVGGLWYRLHY